MRLCAARLLSPLAALLLIAGLAGCGSNDPGGSALTISFQAPASGPLKTRAADIRRAAQLEIDAIHGKAAGHRISLVNGPNNDSIAAIDALSSVTRQAPQQLLVTLRPPVKRATTAARPNAGQIDAPRISLLPPVALTAAAARSYAAPGAPGAKDATVDSPLIPGTPKGRYVTAALSAHSYPPAGSSYFEKYVGQYDRAPDRWAIYGYEAVGLIVDAITRLDKAGLPISQHTVAQEALRIRNRFGPVGHYDVLPSGQTTLYLFQVRGNGAPEGPASLIEALR